MGTKTAEKRERQRAAKLAASRKPNHTSTDKLTPSTATATASSTAANTSPGSANTRQTPTSSTSNSTSYITPLREEELDQIRKEAYEKGVREGFKLGVETQQKRQGPVITVAEHEHILTKADSYWKDWEGKAWDEGRLQGLAEAREEAAELPETIVLTTKEVSSQTDSVDTPHELTKSTPPTPFNWADDATEPLQSPSNAPPMAPSNIPPLIPQQAIRDISVLCSGSTHPFGTLQRRIKRCRTTRQPPHRFSYKPFHSAPHSLPLPTIYPCGPNITHSASLPPFSTGIPGPLDWDSDPRLSHLSLALQALGWIRR